ncbi:MAG: hypothetical protein AAF298_11370 [Cyanobacteria bacterium P01_A01_bin.40]
MIIAINVTNTTFYKRFSQLYLTEIKEYQIWRDRDCAALISKNTRQLIVFGCVKPRPKLIIEAKNIASQDLWQYIQQHHDLLWLATSETEVVLAWEFFRPLDPKLQELYQIRKPKADRLKRMFKS